MNKKTIFKIGALTVFGVSAALLFNSCSVKVPDYIKPVQNFDAEQYAGKWYEIARFDFKHEKDMSNVTAEYSLNSDGTIQVVNKGFDYIKNEWKTSKGKAKFNSADKSAALKVSFFGPFYGGYNVVMMDPDYKTALIFGENTDYIWILSREKSIPESTKEKFLNEAKKAGYDLNRLVWTKHDKE